MFKKIGLRKQKQHDQKKQIRVSTGGNRTPDH